MTDINEEFEDLFSNKQAPEVDPNEPKINKYIAARKAKEEQVDNLEAEVKEVKEEDNVPAKFKGKSMNDIIQSYTELEKQYGRQANEFGELRKLTDKILLDRMESETKDNAKHDKVSVSFDDLIEDPETTVDKLVQAKVKPLADKLDQYEKKERFDAFQTKFPNFKQDLADEEFLNWVQSSSYRTKLLQDADVKYDTDSAVELWSTWTERKELLGKAAQLAKEEKAAKADDALRRASTETGSTGATSRKVFRRSDLIRLRAEDPERYNAMASEIRQAYAEGRVK